MSDLEKRVTALEASSNRYRRLSALLALALAGVLLVGATTDDVLQVSELVAEKITVKGDFGGYPVHTVLDGQKIEILMSDLMSDAEDPSSPSIPRVRIEGVDGASISVYDWEGSLAIHFESVGMSKQRRLWIPGALSVHASGRGTEDEPFATTMFLGNGAVRLKATKEHVDLRWPGAPDDMGRWVPSNSKETPCLDGSSLPAETDISCISKEIRKKRYGGAVCVLPTR